LQRETATAPNTQSRFPISFSLIILFAYQIGNVRLAFNFEIYAKMAEKIDRVIGPFFNQAKKILCLIILAKDVQKVLNKNILSNIISIYSKRIAKSGDMSSEDVSILKRRR